MEATMIKANPDATIDALRRRLASDGWIIDPTTPQGYAFGHTIGLTSEKCNIMASYQTPHGACMIREANAWYRLKASFCEGNGYGGRLITRIAVNQYGPFGKHDTPEQWADKAYQALTSLRLAKRNG